ncbi:transcriptional repressor LexA [Thermodesulfobacteriota bacterium]
MELTKRQEEVLNYIRTFQEKIGITPTVREICGHLGLTAPAGIHRILHVLVEKGCLISTTGKKRSWRIPGGPIRKNIPIIGRIAAGAPIMAIENREDELAMDPLTFGTETCFALRVQGDSMLEAHIADGDLAIIQPQSQADNGQIAAVIVEDLLTEATLKIVKKKNGFTELLPANKAYKPIVLKGTQQNQIKIIGKLGGIIRREC